MVAIKEPLAVTGVAPAVISALTPAGAAAGTDADRGLMAQLLVLVRARLACPTVAAIE